MNVNDGAIADGHNFSDSLTKQCGIGVGFIDTNKSSSNLFTSPETGMPSGNAVNYILKMVSGGGNMIQFNGRPAAFPSTVARACIRVYAQVSTDWSPACVDNIRNKIVTLGSNPSPWEWEEEPYAACGASQGSYSSFHSFNSTGSRISWNMNWNDCSERSGGGWCRFEACISGDLDNGVGGVTAQAQLTALGSGKQRTETQNLSVPAGVYFFNFNPYHNGPNGFMKISHFMQAEWPTNSGQWIGPAREVEGGSGSPPPAPTAPPAPKLLP